MDKLQFPGGVWPVMLTPYDSSGQIDFSALRELTEWYLANGVNGLFAVCQSSEMFFLSLAERCEIARTVSEQVRGRVPVICSGHCADTSEDQVHELNALSETGVDALVLVTNRLAAQDESDDLWRFRCSALLERICSPIPLGLYECPYPYKRLLTPETLRWCADTERFYFLKDTCCQADQLRLKLAAVSGSRLKIYNANSTTLLASLRAGAAGYSGVMANFHPELYVWLCAHADSSSADALSDWLSLASLIERQCYPVNAKYHLSALCGLHINLNSRVQDCTLLTETFREEVRMMSRQARLIADRIGAGKREGSS